MHPQELSIRDQVAAVRAAPLVVGCDGSALHLLAFARPGTKLLAIDSRMVENQVMLDVQRGLDSVHVLASTGGPTLRDEPWSADLGLVEQAVRLAGLGA
jgi:capsular polysaccharide biosynthesis protein